MCYLICTHVFSYRKHRKRRNVKIEFFTVSWHMTILSTSRHNNKQPQHKTWFKAKKLHPWRVSALFSGVGLMRINYFCNAAINWDEETLTNCSFWLYIQLYPDHYLFGNKKSPFAGAFGWRAASKPLRPIHSPADQGAKIQVKQADRPDFVTAPSLAG